jgi:hypothetical protein
MAANYKTIRRTTSEGPCLASLFAIGAAELESVPAFCAWHPVAATALESGDQ